MIRYYTALILFCLAPLALAGELRPAARASLNRITSAAVQRDSAALIAECKAIMELKRSYTPDEYGGMLANAALALDSLAQTSPEVRADAYKYLSLAREAVSLMSPGETMHLAPRLAWHSSQYSSELDVRPFEVARREETEARLLAWRRIEDQVAEAQLGGPPKMNRDMTDRDQAGRAQYLSEREALNGWVILNQRSPQYAEKTFTSVAANYTTEPVEFDEVRGLIEYHTKGTRFTNAWERVVASVQPRFRQRAAAAYPKPPVARERHSLLLPVVSTPYTPAISRPSKFHDKLAANPVAGLVGAATGPAASAPGSAQSSGGEPSSSRTVWPWAVLGLGTLLGGWLWLRQRA